MLHLTAEYHFAGDPHELKIARIRTGIVGLAEALAAVFVPTFRQARISIVNQWALKREDVGMNLDPQVIPNDS
jgi:hypothetical protein